MSLPVLLLVDDSESILAFERAALVNHYTCVTASNGEEALDVAARVKPAGILLDLSMPVLDGYEALVRMKADPALREIPVVVVSSETHRTNACLAAGAADFLPKPLKADRLLSVVAAVLERNRRAKEAESLAVMVLGVSGARFAIPLTAVRRVIPQIPPHPLHVGPSYLDEAIRLDDQVIPVLDLARRLGRQLSVPYVDRRLVVVDAQDTLLALAVDEVRDPERVPAEGITPPSKMALGDHGRLAGALVAFARTTAGELAVVRPESFLSRLHLARLKVLARHTPDAPEAAPENLPLTATGTTADGAA